MKPLRNQTILVTRPATEENASSDGLTQLLLQAGADVISKPVIQILPPEHWDEVDSVVASRDRFSWLVFTSPHGVRFFLSRCLQLGLRPEELAEKKIAVVGEQTGEVLTEYFLQPHLVPSEFDSRSLASELIKRMESQLHSVLLVRGSRGSRVLPDSLKDKSIPFQEIVVYRSLDVDQVDSKTREMMETGKFDWTTVSSSAIARSCVKLFGESLHKTKLVSISPQTSGVLEELGFHPAAEAKVFNMAGMLRAMVDT